MARLARVMVSSSRSTTSPAANALAVAHQQLADDAASQVLHLLDVGVDDDRSRCDHRAGQLGGRGPAADPDGQQQGDDDAAQEVPANGEAFVASDVLFHRLHPLVCGTTLSGAGGCGSRAGRLGQDLVLRPEGLLRSSHHCQHVVHSRQRAWSMRDDDHDPAARANAENGLGERLLAFGIEIGIGLVEHDQERLAVESARERNSLLLSSGQRRPALAELGLVAGGQIDDQVMHAGGLGRGDYGCRGRVLLEAGDVLRNRSFEQLDILRQITDVAAAGRGGPLIDGRPIEPHAAADSGPYPDDRSHQRRLARGARADDT